MERNDLKGFIIPPRTAVRVVLNGSTMSVFQSDNFGDINFSLTLQDLEVKNIENKNNCIKV